MECGSFAAFHSQDHGSAFLLTLNRKPTWCLSGGLRGEGDFAAEIAQTAKEPVDDPGAIAAVEVIRAEILILDAIAEHEVGGGEHGRGDGEDRLLGSAASSEAEELGVQIAVLHANGRPSGGYER